MAEETQTTETGENTGGGGGFTEIVKRLAGSDQRVSGLTEPGGENAEMTEIKNNQIRMQVEQEYDRSVRELQKLNPDASDNQIEDLASAIQSNDAIKVDKVSKDIARTAEETRKKEEREKKGAVNLQAGDTGGESNADAMPSAQGKEGFLKRMIGAVSFP